MDRITLPELRYKMGEEPLEDFKVIDKFSDYKYIGQVKEILGPTQFKRIEESYLGPVLKLSTRNLLMSGKMIHTILTKSLITQKENELWFHFGGQPMRFSLREFHMVTGLKCSAWVPETDEETELYAWGEWKDGHTPDDLIELMVHADKDAHDEKFFLVMLLLIETIFLHKHSKAKFPTENLMKAQSMDVLMNHPWGVEAYTVLLENVKKTVDKKLEKTKYYLNGFPFALHIWILESIPKLLSAFSTINKSLPNTAYLCEKYMRTSSPSIKEVLSIEGEPHLRVIHVLPKIPGDPEDDVCLEDNQDEDLDSLLDVLKKGFKLRYEHWTSKVLDRNEALEEIASQSYRYPQSEISRPAPTGLETGGPSSSGSSLDMKLSRLMKLFADGQRKIFARLSKIEQKLGIYDPENANEEDFFCDFIFAPPPQQSPPNQRSTVPTDETPLDFAEDETLANFVVFINLKKFLKDMVDVFKTWT